MMEISGGVYLALFRLERCRRLRVGRLGLLTLPAGTYAYAGSAQRNLLSRLNRHARRRKTRHWHIDYLSSVAPMLGTLLFAAGKQGECVLARRLARGGAKGVPGFGCGDCHCPSHLYLLPPGGMEWLCSRIA